jgi:hypothetical protein
MHQNAWHLLFLSIGLDIPAMGEVPRVFVGGSDCDGREKRIPSVSVAITNQNVADRQVIRNYFLHLITNFRIMGDWY